jgi:hypothetical protein
MRVGELRALAGVPARGVADPELRCLHAKAPAQPAAVTA